MVFKNKVVYRENVDESYCLAFQNIYAQFINCWISKFNIKEHAHFKYWSRTSISHASSIVSGLWPC